MKLVDPAEDEKLVLDLELEHGLNKAVITRTTMGMIEAIRRATGSDPILYSRALWMNEFLEQGEFPREIELWLAQYLIARDYPLFTEEHPGSPMLPSVLKNWVIHQTGEKGSGADVGVGSYYCDYDRFNGDEVALEKWFGGKTKTSTLEGRVNALEVRIAKIEQKL